MYREILEIAEKYKGVSFTRQEILNQITEARSSSGLSGKVGDGIAFLVGLSGVVKANFKPGVIDDFFDSVYLKKMGHDSYQWQFVRKLAYPD